MVRRACLLACMRGMINLALVLGASTMGAVGGEADTAPAPNSKPAFPPADVEFFEARVRPILVDKCIKCHGPTKQSSGLRLDSREAVLRGGESGPAAVVAARPDESLLVQAVAQTHAELKMPPAGKLPEPQVAVLRQWVALGLPWSTAPNKSVASATGSNDPEAPPHWAFQPIKQAAPSPSADVDRGWARTPIDAFILAKLKSAGIAPSPRADRRTLIRRATIDLWGVPPTADEIDAFEADRSIDAYERLVDRLLSSPRYGERWGRHWLDVARYADTKGYVFTQDRRYPYAYTYRDYVISALNADLGYDRFIIEQLAADQIAKGDDHRSLAALGFLTVGRRFLLDQNEIIDDRIDVVTRGLLGLTVTCARCHDHKFDPIPTEDYYSLYGVFASSVEPANLPTLGHPGDPAKAVEYRDKVAEATAARDRYLTSRRDEFAADLRDRASEYLAAARELDFDPGDSKLDERGLAGKLNTRRLRAVMTIWKRHLDATSKGHDPIVAPWNAFAALSDKEFKAKAAELRQTFLAPATAQSPAVHPLVVKHVLGTPPASNDEVAERYTALVAQLESRWKAARARSPEVKTLPEPDWESLRQALFGAHGVFSISGETMREFLDQEQAGQLDQLDGALVHLESTHPGAPARAMVINDAPQPVEPHVFIRGNPARRGKAVPRRFLKVLSKPERPPFQKGSGRLELAQAIVGPTNPLTARVLVNRVWFWHFGKGLVNTPSDFGLRSDAPTHPELLDRLASDFIASGWSLKSLHRRIMLSSTYQQRSEPRADGLSRDPENRLVWRFNRQRLDFESMRDSILAVCGELDSTIGGPAVLLTEAPFSARRTLYGFIDRQNLDGLYRTFDFAVPDATNPRRFVTTVPQQALFLMNSPFMHQRARELTVSLGLTAGPAAAGPSVSTDTVSEGVQLLYRRLLGRSPQPDELKLGITFVRQQAAATHRDAGAWTQQRRSPSPGRGDGLLSPWAQLGQVLLLTNEFMFVD